MARRPTLRNHIETGILDAATAVFTEHGASASMARVAEAAGVSRATLYRYFPNRDALLRGLVTAAIGELADRVAEAELDTVPVREGLARLSRTFLAAGSKYAVLARSAGDDAGATEKTSAELGELDSKVAQPIRDLIARGVADGSFRADLPADVLFELFVGMLERLLRLTAHGHIGTERAAAAITEVFFDGAAG